MGLGFSLTCMTVKPCLVCGVLFVPGRGGKYCGPACAFWRWVGKSQVTDCWEWTGTRFHSGYGRMKYNRVVWYAHRYSWVFHNAAIPSGLIVCHKCDNPPCCNPGHLFLGTHKDNAADRDRKHRQDFYKGEDHPAAKLTVDDIKGIRRLYESGVRGKLLDRMYGISPGYGWRINNRITWRHVH